jgi:acylphosphatase
LRGLARNLDDGRVEVLAFGPAQALDALEAWLAIGPPQARVERVHREPLGEEPGEPGFKVA